MPDSIFINGIVWLDCPRFWWVRKIGLPNTSVMDISWIGDSLTTLTKELTGLGKTCIWFCWTTCIEFVIGLIKNNDDIIFKLSLTVI